MTVKRVFSMTVLTVGLWLTTTVAIAQTIDYHFHWAASPTVDAGDNPLPQAVGYEVWLREDADAERRIATVMGDTIYTLRAEAGIVQRIRVCGFDDDGRKSAMSEWSDPIYFEDDVRSLPGAPGAAALDGNYPNPFNPETRINYGIPDDIAAGTVVRLEIFALNGRRVRELVTDRTPGWHEAIWDGRDDQGLAQATGMYVTRLVVGNSMSTSKMTMVK